MPGGWRKRGASCEGEVTEQQVREYITDLQKRGKYTFCRSMKLTSHHDYRQAISSIRKHGSPHTLRNNFAKRCLMAGMGSLSLNRRINVTPPYHFPPLCLQHRQSGFCFHPRSLPFHPLLLTSSSMRSFQSSGMARFGAQRMQATASPTAS